MVQQKFDFQGWIKTALIVIVSLITFVWYIGELNGTVTKNSAAIEQHGKWIEAHTTDMKEIMATLHALDNNQGIMMERVFHIQENVTRLLKENRP